MTDDTLGLVPEASANVFAQGTLIGVLGWCALRRSAVAVAFALGLDTAVLFVIDPATAAGLAPSVGGDALSLGPTESRVRQRRSAGPVAAVAPNGRPVPPVPYRDGHRCP